MRPFLVAVAAALYFNGSLLLNRVVLVESFQVPSTSTTTAHCRQQQHVATNYEDDRVGVVKRRRIQQLSTTWTHRPVVLLPTFHHQHQPKSSLLSLTSSSSSYNNNNNNNNDDSNSSIIDPIITRASLALRASSWVSWWSQLILTVVSTITFLFARNVLADTGGGGSSSSAKVLGKFVLPGVGIALSSLSIVWTWGQRRLARQLVRQLRKNSNNNNNKNNNNINNNKKKNKTANNIIQSKVNVANLLRRTIHVGCILNILGLLTSIAGAQVIVGTLAAKSMQVFVAGSGLVTSSQTLQPLDVLIVQANTNILSSHFVSLVCLLYLTRIIDALDPPSLDDDDIIDI
jgi:hypothetical protein